MISLATWSVPMQIDGELHQLAPNGHAGVVDGPCEHTPRRNETRNIIGRNLAQIGLAACGTVMAAVRDAIHVGPVPTDIEGESESTPERQAPREEKAATAVK